MTPTLLVLGGSGFVGRTVVETGLDRQWSVTTYNRGHRPLADPRIEQLIGDRADAAALRPLGDRDWDLVVDTWAGAPCTARAGAAILSERTARYVYVSSASVYEPPPPIGADEETPTVNASAAATSGSYAELKRGSELAIIEAFGDRALLARAGLILGPYENVGRLPWWCHRIAAGGDVLAPGPPELALQYVDARDLARFVLDAAPAGHKGAFNVVSRSGHATMSTLLEACVAATGSGARLRWATPELILEAGIEPWSELPIWIPPGHEYAGMHGANVERAHAAGLRCRPVAETVADTWAWMSTLSGPAPLRPELDPPGLDRERERALLAGLTATA